MKNNKMTVLLGVFLLVASLSGCYSAHKNIEQENIEQENIEQENAEQENIEQENTEQENTEQESTGVDPMSVEYPEKRSEEEILQMIKDYEEEQSNTSTKDLNTKPTVSVTECNIPELYEKTGIQAYFAYTEEGMGNGSYLIYEDEVCPITDSLEHTCIADIDQNGTYELLSLWGFGSGIYRIQLNVYQYGNPIYFSGPKKIVHLNYSNWFIPNHGYGSLKFNKMSDTEVHLVDGDTNTDYGKLIVQKDLPRIVPKNMEIFPYEEWSYTPALIVTVGDIEIVNHLTLTDWNGVKEEPVSFAELMNEEIPMFTCKEGEKILNEVKLSFAGLDTPTSIVVKDYLINENGSTLYTSKVVIERQAEQREDGNYYFPLDHHWALFLSSHSSSYTKPAFRGFRISCEFGEGRSCEYAFVLSTAPVWKEVK